MFFRSTLENVRALYPEALDAAVAVLRHSRSKRAKEPLVSFEWGFEVAVECPPLHIESVVSGAPVEWPSATLSDKLRDYERRAHVFIAGMILGRRYVESERLPTVPAIVLEAQRRHLLAEEADQRQYAALSKEEQQRRLDAALSQLARGGGFIAVGGKRSE